MKLTREGLRKKLVTDCRVLAKVIEAHKILGHEIVLTIGSWDLLHIGHARYLLEAFGRGDILVAGVDSDEVTKKYKGEFRPIVPQEERMEMLAYLPFVHYITVVEDVDENGNWEFGLVKALRPEVFVAVEDSYPPEQIKALEQYCGAVCVLPRQAENTSTSDFVQRILKGAFLPMIEKVSKGGKR